MTGVQCELCEEWMSYDFDLDEYTCDCQEPHIFDLD
jgi:hypothetical protein